MNSKKVFDSLKIKISSPLHSSDPFFLKNPGLHWQDQDLSRLCLQTSLFLRLHSLGHPSVVGTNVFPGFLNVLFRVVVGRVGLGVVVGGLVGNNFKGGPVRCGLGVVGSVGLFPDLNSCIGFLVRSVVVLERSLGWTAIPGGEIEVSISYNIKNYYNAEVKND